MYGIPEDLDLSPIVGEYTTQIHVGAYDLQFELGDVCFNVQSELKLFKEGAHIATWKPGIWPPKELYELFNLEVEGVSIPNSKEIAISFKRGLSAHLYDNSEQYESMIISIKGTDADYII